MNEYVDPNKNRYLGEHSFNTSLDFITLLCNSDSQLHRFMFLRSDNN